ncbi:MAG: endonuclease III domain-containing protein [Minisyncoccia bacterium]
MLKKLLLFYRKKLKKFPIKDSQWRLWCKSKKSPKEKEWVIIEAILTQQTNWRNVEKAMANLKKERKDSLTSINKLSKSQLAKLIKPSGFYQIKAEYLKNIARFFVKNGGIKNLEKLETEILRRKLLNIKGVGYETADSILLYVFNRPVFVVDAYTKRLVGELKLKIKNLSYNSLQKFFIKIFPRNVSFYQKFHAIIVLYYKNKK